MSTNYENLIVEMSAPVARVTLNRPERRNALSLALMRELTACLREIGGSDETRAIILSAAGSVFSSGHDLTEMRGRSINDYRRIFDACVGMMNAVQSVPQPVIAEVQGMATAAGCQLVAACDLAVAAEEAKFATPGVRIGLFCSTPMVALTRARRPNGAWSTTSRPPSVCAKRLWRWPNGSSKQARSSSGSANRPSTRRSISTSRRLTTTPKK